MTSKDITITYGNEAGDCTRPYYVTLGRSDITVEEFVKYVMDELKSEWGYIRIYTHNVVNPWSADYEFEYSHGVAKSSEVIPPYVLASCIKTLSGSGGWSRSDWDIIIEGKEQMNKQEAINKAMRDHDFGYSSPIQLILSDIQMKLEDNVCEAVHSVGVNVDKDELIKALQYDRDQYSKGFQDGYESSMRDVMLEVKAERSLLLSWLSKFARHIDMPDHLSDEEAKKLWSKKMAEQFGWEGDPDA